jgi:hypothetical protein
MPAQKDGEGQEEENNEVRPPEQEEEEEVVEEGAQPRRPLLPVLCHAVACALHPIAASHCVLANFSVCATALGTACVEAEAQDGLPIRISGIGAHCEGRQTRTSAGV